jgi:glycosyltransferase involved in cell wall biosynthesis
LDLHNGRSRLQAISDNKLKIAILQTPTSPLNLDIHGGMERNELLELKGLQKKGYVVKLFVSKLIGADPHIQQIKDLSWRNRLFKFYYYLNFSMKAINYDVYHGYFTPILALLFPQKSLIHFHGNAIFELPLYRHFEKRYQNSWYMFCSDYTKNEFREIYPNLNQERLMTLYNCVDTDFFKPASSDVSKRKTVNICFYGGWIPEKGIYDVLEAAEILERKGRRDYKIYYGGSAHSHYKDSKWGDSREIDQKVREWANRLESVELVGDITYKNLPVFLQKMDIGVVPSSYPEPFGIVNIEIMACGLPVIATKVGGIPEVVVDGETGLLIEPNNPQELALAIEKLLDNPELRIKMGKAGRKRVEEKFSWEKHIERLVEIYRKMRSSPHE